MSVHEKMTAIADAIRGKTGKTEVLTLDQMAAEITGIQGGEGITFTSSVVSSIPTVVRSAASSTFDLPVLESSATGVLQEE